MELRSIGSLQVSVIGLGTNNFGGSMSAENVTPVVEAALDVGINFFDTADSYGASEQRLAEALGSRRDDVVIATKFASKLSGVPESGGARPEYIKRAVEASLSRLNTDYIDLYQMHWPDPETPIADSLGALQELVVAGKVREIGCSNFSTDLLRDAAAAAGSGPGFVSIENHYNLFHRDDEAELLPLCQSLNVAYLPYFPLGSGVLTGKYRRGEPVPEGSRRQVWGEVGEKLVPLDDGVFDRVEALQGWAADHGHNLVELAIAWLAAIDPVASVIAGATRPEQVHANAAAAGWRLTADEVAEVRKLAS